MLKCFPAKSLKFIPHQIGSMETGIIMQKDDFTQQHSRAFWFYTHRSFCYVSALCFALIVAPCSMKSTSRGPCSHRRRSWLYWYSYGRFWISFGGGGGELRCYHCWLRCLLLGSKWWHHVLSPVMICDRNAYFSSWYWDMQPVCQSFVPPSVDAEPTASKFFRTAGDLW